MKLIFRYLFRKCLFNSFLVLIAFSTIAYGLGVLTNIGYTGVGSFNFNALLFYQMLLLPGLIYLILPLSVLLGVIIGLLSLVNYSEYAIIRTSGVSLFSIAKFVCIYGFIFLVANFIFGEFVVPISNNYSKIYYKQKRNETMSTKLKSGIWTKDGDNSFINILRLDPDNSIHNLTSFTYDNTFSIKSYFTAKKGIYDDKLGAWKLSNVDFFNYGERRIIESSFENYIWNTTIKPRYFSILVIEPSDMSLVNLFNYMANLKNSHQSIAKYLIEFWSKLTFPFSNVSMALIALSFVPNNRRSANLGGRLFLGILVGIGFFFISKFVGMLAFIFHWDGALAALIPSILLFVIGSTLIYLKE